MNQLGRILQEHPLFVISDRESFIRCIQECYQCLQICMVCSDACMAEDQVEELKECIKLNEHCALICQTTGHMLLRQFGMDSRGILNQLDQCAKICHSCGEMCRRHAEEYKHCGVCAEACFRCEEACNDLMVALK